MYLYIGKGHPWMDFLHHRARAIRWLRNDMKKNPETIAKELSMNTSQVQSILVEVNRNPQTYE